MRRTMEQSNRLVQSPNIDASPTISAHPCHLALLHCLVQLCCFDLRVAVSMTTLPSTSAFPSTLSSPTVISQQSAKPPFPPLHPAIHHHTLAAPRSSSASAASPSQSGGLASWLNPRTVLLSSLAVSSSALLLYSLSRRYTLSSSFPYLRRRSSPLSDALSGLHVLHDLQRYASNGIIIPSPESFLSIRSRLIADGPGRLQLICDFDHTLSSFASLSSHGALEHSSSLPADYQLKVKQLYDKYYPIEMDMSVGNEEKARVMVDWWEAAHALLLSYRFRRSYITAAVSQAMQSGRLQLRAGAAELLRYCSAQSLPLLVFSAGLGDCIASFLAQSQLLFPCVDIVSNWMRWGRDEAAGDEVIVGFESDLIHSLNKDYHHVRRQREREGRGREALDALHAESRRNVLLLGDSLGDVRMVHGLEGVGALLRVGFVNGRCSEEKMRRYRETYDVLICDREDGSAGSMDFVLELLQMLCEPAQRA